MYHPRLEISLSAVRAFQSLQFENSGMQFLDDERVFWLLEGAGGCSRGEVGLQSSLWLQPRAAT